jgi:hypothetical protein
MRLNVAETCVVSYSKKTNVLSYEYQRCHTTSSSTGSIKDQGIFFDPKLHFQTNVDFLFSDWMKFLDIIRSITLRFSSLDCLYVLYFMLARSKLEFASVVSNVITSTAANNLERNQQKFASIGFYRFSPHILYFYIFALENLGLYSSRKRRHHLDAFFFLFRPIVTLNSELPSRKMLVFVFILTVLGTSQNLLFVL